MAEIDDELRRILEGAGKDIAKIREALTGTSKALIKNTDTQKKQQKVVQELIKRNEKLRDHLKQNNALTEEQNETIDDNIKVIKKHSEETKAKVGVSRWMGRHGCRVGRRVNLPPGAPAIDGVYGCGVSRAVLLLLGPPLLCFHHEERRELAEKIGQDSPSLTGGSH